MGLEPLKGQYIDKILTQIKMDFKTILTVFGALL